MVDLAGDVGGPCQQLLVGVPAGEELEADRQPADGAGGHRGRGQADVRPRQAEPGRAARGDALWRGAGRGRGEPQVDPGGPAARLHLEAPLERGAAVGLELRVPDRPAPLDPAGGLRPVTVVVPLEQVGVLAGQLAVHQPPQRRGDLLGVLEHAQAPHLVAGRGQRLDLALEQLARGRLDSLQEGPLGHAEHGQQRAADRVPALDQHGRGQRDAADVACEQADAVEAPGHVQRAVGADPAVAGHVPDHAAEGRRPDGRADRLGAERQRKEPGRHARGGAVAGAARRARSRPGSTECLGCPAAGPPAGGAVRPRPTCEALK